MFRSTYCSLADWRMSVWAEYMHSSRSKMLKRKTSFYVQHKIFMLTSGGGIEKNAKLK